MTLPTAATVATKTRNTGTRVIAALYVDPRGPYPALDYRHGGEAHSGRIGGVDCWDASRDARKYAGPHPVVAHPPCKHWGRLRHLAHWLCVNCDCQWSGPGSELEEGGCPQCGEEPVSDRDCAPRAVEQVRAYGGVLEHPAGSKLWEACGLPSPRLCASFPCDCGAPAHGHETTEGTFTGETLGWRPIDTFGGYTIELDQVEWGHVARKRTWLYLVGVPREALEAPPFPGREPTHYASGGRTESSRSGGAVPAGMKVCSAQQRRRTPPPFAEYLVRLARAVRK